MGWKKIELTQESVALGELDVLMNKFLETTTKVGVFRGIGVFASKMEDKVMTLFFTPGSSPYFDHILAEYHATASHQPSAQEVEAFLFGDNSMWEFIKED